MLVRNTSAKVPKCGSPLGPYPVWKIISPTVDTRGLIRRASSKGHAFDNNAACCNWVSDMRYSISIFCVTREKNDA